MTDSHILRPAELLDYWLGHRRLTRRVIEAFPDDQLFTFTPAPPMRSFGQLAWEIQGQSGEVLTGLVDGTWGSPTWNPLPSTEKADLLRAWDGLSARPGSRNSWRFPDPVRRTHGLPPAERADSGGDPGRDRQRDSPPGAGQRLPPFAGHQTAGLLGALRE